MKRTVYRVFNVSDGTKIVFKKIESDTPRHLCKYCIYDGKTNGCTKNIMWMCDSLNDEEFAHDFWVRTLKYRETAHERRGRGSV